MIHQMAPKTNVQKNAPASLTQTDVVERVLALIENGYYEEADMLASAELLLQYNDAELWMVAGLARFQKGNLRTAESAFKMSAWLTDNPVAREMLKLIGEL